VSASAIPPAQWRQTAVPTGTLSSFVRSESSTARYEENAITYTHRGPPPRSASHVGVTGIDRPREGATFASRSVALSSASSTLAIDVNQREAAPVLMLPVHPAAKRRFIPLSRREGVVLEVRADEFDARLVDLDGGETDLEATFAVEELSPNEVSLLRPGAIFYWTIGYFDDQFGCRTRVSDLRFRRLPAEDAQGLAKAESEADQIRRELGLE
jgi:hypothetical protein